MFWGEAFMTARALYPLVVCAIDRSWKGELAPRSAEVGAWRHEGRCEAKQMAGEMGKHMEVAVGD